MQYRCESDDEGLEVEQSSSLLDLDCRQGAESAKSYLACIERLVQVFNVPLSSRDYRSEFSSSYKSLFANNATSAGEASFLTEILYSA